MICEGGQKQEEEKIPINLKPFAEAIVVSRAHREMFLQFGIGDGTVGRSNLNCQIREDRKFVIAHWVASVRRGGGQRSVPARGRELAESRCRLASKAQF
jgi:hypothetical protein